MQGFKYQAEPKRKRICAKFFYVLRRILKVLTFFVFAFFVYELIADRIQPESVLPLAENAGTKSILIVCLPFLYTLLCGIVAAFSRHRIRYFFYALGTLALIAIAILLCVKGSIEIGLTTVYYISLALSFLCCIFVLNFGSFFYSQKLLRIIPIVLVFLSCIFMVYRVFFRGFALKDPFLCEKGVRFLDLLSVYSPFVVTFASGIIGAILKERRQTFTGTLGVLFLAFFVTASAIHFVPSVPIVHNIAYCITMSICIICCFCVLDLSATDWSSSGSSSYYDNHDILNDMTGDEEFIDPDGCDIDVSNM